MKKVIAAGLFMGLLLSNSLIANNSVESYQLGFFTKLFPTKQFDDMDIGLSISPNKFISFGTALSLLFMEKERQGEEGLGFGGNIYIDSNLSLLSKMDSLELSFGVGARLYFESDNLFDVYPYISTSF